MGKKEFDEYVSGITRQRIASICLALGWNSVHQSSMEVNLVLGHYCETLKPVISDSNAYTIFNSNFDIDNARFDDSIYTNAWSWSTSSGRTM